MVRKLRAKRLTYREIGEIFGCSRQYVHQLLTGYTTMDSDASIRSKIPYKCVICGSVEDLALHHIDGNTKNNKVENLEWLCSKCHADEHRNGRGLSDWQKQLHQEKISNAISARKLKDQGWTNGALMDHFGVTETTLIRWFKMLDESPEENWDGDFKTS